MRHVESNWKCLLATLSAGWLEQRERVFVGEESKQPSQGGDRARVAATSGKPGHQGELRRAPWGRTTLHHAESTGPEPKQPRLPAGQQEGRESPGPEMLGLRHGAEHDGYSRGSFIQPHEAISVYPRISSWCGWDGVREILLRPEESILFTLRKAIEPKEIELITEFFKLKIPFVISFFQHPTTPPQPQGIRMKLRE